MACNVSGSPSYRVCLDTAGSFIVADDSGGSEVMRFRVGYLGVVEVTSEIQQDGTLVLHNDSAEDVTILELVSGTSSGTKHFEFEWTGSAAKIRGVDDTSDAPLTLEGAAVRLNNPTSGSVNVVTFQSNGSERGKVAWDNTASEIRVETDNHLTLHFGATTGTARTLSFKTTDSMGTGRILTSLAETGVWSFNDDQGVGQATLDPEDANDDTELTLGLAENTRGKLVLDRERSTGSERAGVLVLTAEDGTEAYLWLAQDTGDSNWYLWAKRSDPGVNEQSGTRIGPGITA